MANKVGDETGICVFLLQYINGVVALKHWYTHNQIRKDRFKSTICTKERNGLYLLEGREYVINAEEILVESSGLPKGNQMTTQGREEEMRIVQDRLGEYMYKLGNESLTEEQVHTLMDQYGKETVDSVIHRILSHPYYHCLNERKIAEWCEEEKNRVPAKKKIHGSEQRDYDFEELEKLLLAN